MIFNINGLCMYVVLYEVLSFFAAMILSASLIDCQCCRATIRTAITKRLPRISRVRMRLIMTRYHSRTKCPKSTWSRDGLVSSVHLSSPLKCTNDVLRDDG